MVEYSKINCGSQPIGYVYAYYNLIWIATQINNEIRKTQSQHMG